MHRPLLLSILAASLQANAQVVHVDFTASRGAEEVRGYFEWEELAPIFDTNVNEMGAGKTLWDIRGAIALNGNIITSMTDARLEVMNNTFIDASAPNSIIGDQITLFGTASMNSGLVSVQNFYFRDESGLLLSRVAQPNSQFAFDSFPSVRVDLFKPGQPGPQSFQLNTWNVVGTVPEPAPTSLFFLGSLAVLSFERLRRNAT